MTYEASIAALWGPFLCWPVCPRAFCQFVNLEAGLFFQGTMGDGLASPGQEPLYILFHL